jgi:hypothetical protein
MNFTMSGSKIGMFPTGFGFTESGAVKFEGNAPTIDWLVFHACSPDLIIYHHKGATGFTGLYWMSQNFEIW